MTENLPKIKKEAQAKISLRRFGQPEDVAGVVVLGLRRRSVYYWPSHRSGWRTLHYSTDYRLTTNSTNFYNTYQLD